MLRASPSTSKSSEKRAAEQRRSEADTRAGTGTRAPAGRGAAEQRARKAARAGFRSAGVLRSDQHSRLALGYWVAFAGVYASSAEAQTAVERARQRAARGLALRALRRRLSGRALRRCGRRSGAPAA